MSWIRQFDLLLRSEVATVIDIPIDPEEDVYPFVAPGTGLKDMITGCMNSELSIKATVFSTMTYS